MNCIECGKPAEWVRCTQFAGDHPYCEEHAKLEKDFGQDDSYAFWYQIEEKPKNPDVQIGRLQKKLNKMRDQRDKARSELDHYKHIISMQPHLATRYEAYQDRIAERQRVKDLESRVKEQAELIIQLQKEIARLESKPLVFPLTFPSPSMPYQPYKGCSVCGLGADGGATGYACPRTDCPSAVRC